MSQSYTPSKPRVSGQLSGSGTIASEDALFKDETAGRKFYIPFAPFAGAFLRPRPEDKAEALAHKDSPEFRAAYNLLCTSISASLDESHEIYSPLADLINHVLDSELAHQPAPNALPLRFTDRTSSSGIRDDGNNRKPDLVGAQSLPALSWTAVSIACEYKCKRPLTHQQDPGDHAQPGPLGSVSRSQSQTSGLPVLAASRPNRGPPRLPVERDLQLARYLLEIRSNQVTRNAVFGILFMKDQASFWYADSDSTIKSRYVSVDSIEFITALMCLAHVDATSLGYSPRFQANGTVVTSSAVENVQFIYSLDVNSPDASVYPLSDVISHARALHGRCSRVLGLTSDGQDLALKLSHQVITRTNEATLIERAHQRGIDGVIDIIFWVDLEKLSDGPRSHLPPGLIKGARQDLLVEDHVWRLLVFPRCMPLYRVLNPQHFLRAAISLLKSICSLYQAGNIMHRDISVNNLMVKLGEPWVGVLIDLDLARDLQVQLEESASLLHRTGTLLFMALDLIHDCDDYPQYHRHDLESFVYVLAWIAARYKDGQEFNKSMFRKWCEGDWQAIRDNKLAFIGLSDPYTVFSANSPYIFLTGPIDKLRTVLHNAHYATRVNLANTGQHTAVDAKGKQHAECPDEGYVEAFSGSKRKRQGASTQTEKVQAKIYPEDLTGLNKDILLSALEEALKALDAVPPAVFAGSD